MYVVRDRNPATPRRRSLLVGPSKEARLIDQRYSRQFDSMVELRLQKVRLEQIRIKAEQREQDREIERLRIEERTRAREDRERLTRFKREEETAQLGLDEQFKQTKERFDKRQKDHEAQMEAAKAKAAREALLAEQVARLMRGEWTPPEGDDAAPTEG